VKVNVWSFPNWEIVKDYCLSGCHLAVMLVNYNYNIGGSNDKTVKITGLRNRNRSLSYYLSFKAK
jgi:hypothetical protein